MEAVTVGRDSDNGAVISGIKISRHHAQIIKDGNNYRIVDLNSTNGTFVNGRKISGAMELIPNDRVRLGDTELEWLKYFGEKVLVTEKIAQPNYAWLKIACWIAIFFTVIETVQNLNIIRVDNGTHDILVAIFNAIPEWLVIICSAALEVYLFLGLRQYAVAKGKSKGIPFIAYIVLSIFLALVAPFAALFIDVYSEAFDSMSDKEAGIAVLIFLPAILLMLALSIIQPVLGLKLKNKLPEASTVGEILTVTGIGAILLLIISLVATGDVQWWVYLLLGVCSTVLFYYLKNFFTGLMNEEDKKIIA